MTFLEHKFTIYALDEEKQADKDSLRALKACDAAQKVFKRPAVSDPVKLWELWEDERTKVYNEIGNEEQENTSVDQNVVVSA
jgi:hypothetical protein